MQSAPLQVNICVADLDEKRKKVVVVYNKWNCTKKINHSCMIFASIQYILDIAFILVPYDNMSVNDFFSSSSRSDEYIQYIQLLLIYFHFNHLHWKWTDVCLNDIYACQDCRYEEVFLLPEWKDLCCNKAWHPKSTSALWTDDTSAYTYIYQQKK